MAVHSLPGTDLSVTLSRAGRTPGRKRRGFWQNDENMKAELFAFIRATGRDPDVMPTPSEMRKENRLDLLRAVTRSGGTAVVAGRFHLRTSRKPNNYWTKPTIKGSATRAATANLRRALAQVSTEAGLENPEVTMPTVTILLGLKRYDLMNAVAKAGGFMKVAEDLSLRTVRDIRRVNSASSSAAEGGAPGQETDGQPRSCKMRRDWSSFRVFEQDLRSFSVEHCDGNMPTQMELRNHSRHDLINALRRHGGVEAVARRAALSIRTGRRPRGHWTDRAVLLAELGAYTARYGKPGLMPRREELLAAGRSDLYYAIRRHGGFSSVAAELHLMWYGPSTYWRNFKNLQKRLMAHVKQIGARHPALAGSMPSTQALHSCGREDLIFGIAMHGGSMNVAARTGLSVTYPHREEGYWAQPQNIQREVESFCLTQPLELRDFMPSSICLVESGRGDLANAVRDHGGWVYYAQRLGLRHSFEVRPQGFWHAKENVYKELALYVGRRYGDWDFPGSRPHPRAVPFSVKGEACTEIATTPGCGRPDFSGQSDADTEVGPVGVRVVEESEDVKSSGTEELATASVSASLDPTVRMRPVRRKRKLNRPVAKQDWTKRKLLYAPSVEMLKRDGRSDLAFAIHRYQGGEEAFAIRHGLVIAADSNEMLPYEELSRWRTFAREMLGWIDAHGCCGIMPNRSDLILTGRNDLRYAIYSHGGNINVARRLELVSLDDKNWVAKWLRMQASRLGLYLSTPVEKRGQCAWTGEEKLPVRVRVGSMALKLANLRERRLRSAAWKGRLRKRRSSSKSSAAKGGSDADVVASEKATGFSVSTASTSLLPAIGQRSEAVGAQEADLRHTHAGKLDGELSDVEFEALRKRYAHLPPDDIIAP